MHHLYRLHPYSKFPKIWWVCISDHVLYRYVARQCKHASSTQTACLLWLSDEYLYRSTFRVRSNKWSQQASLTAFVQVYPGFVPELICECNLKFTPEYNRGFIPCRIQPRIHPWIQPCILQRFLNSTLNSIPNSCLNSPLSSSQNPEFKDPWIHTRSYPWIQRRVSTWTNLQIHPWVPHPWIQSCLHPWLHP